MHKLIALRCIAISATLASLLPSTAAFARRACALLPSPDEDAHACGRGGQHANVWVGLVCAIVLAVLWLV